MEKEKQKKRFEMLQKVAESKRKMSIQKKLNEDIRRK